MSRARKQTRRERPRTSVWVVIVLLWRTVIFASVPALAILLVRQGLPPADAGETAVLLVASATATSLSLTRGSLSAIAGR